MQRGGWLFLCGKVPLPSWIAFSTNMTQQVRYTIRLNAIQSVQGIFKRENGPLRDMGKRPIKAGKRPIKEGKRPINANGQFSGARPWWKTAPLKRPIKRVYDLRCLESSKVPEGHHPRGTTLREALRGNLPLRGLCGGLSEGCAGSLRGFCGVSAGFCGVLRGSAGLSEAFRG